MWIVNTVLSAVISTAIVVVLEFSIIQRNVRWWPEPALTLTWLIFTLTYGLAMIRRRFASWRYGLDEHALTVEYGVWTRTRMSIPRARIQHVEIHEGPWDRRFGIRQLNIHTAGSHSIQIPGLVPEEAERIRAALVLTAATTPPHSFDADAGGLLDP